MCLVVSEAGQFAMLAQRRILPLPCLYDQEQVPRFRQDAANPDDLRRKGGGRFWRGGGEAPRRQRLEAALESFARLSPTFRQRLLHRGENLEETAMLRSPMDLDLVVLPFTDCCNRYWTT